MDRYTQGTCLAFFLPGNLGRVDFISEFEYDLFIRPDTCNPRYRMWFNFVVDNVRADQASGIFAVQQGNCKID